MKIRAAFVTLAVGIGWFAVTATARQQAPPPDFAARPASAVRYLKASNPGEDDRLGVGNPLIGVTMAMSADGNTLAVSAPYEGSGATGVNGNQQDESAWDSGAVYVFVRTGNNWSQQAYIKPSNTQTSDKFGFALALSGDGNTLAVGATLEDSNARGINRQSGGQLRRRLRRRLRLRAQRVDVVPAGVCESLERRRRRPVRLVGRAEPRREHARGRRADGRQRRDRRERRPGGQFGRRCRRRVRVRAQWNRLDAAGLRESVERAGRRPVRLLPRR